MANIDFDKIRKVANEVAEKSVALAKKAADKAVETAKLAKLNTEIMAEREKVKKAYQEIGKVYYHLHKDDAEEEFASAIANLEFAIGNIRAKNAEIQRMKSDDLGDITSEDIAAAAEEEIIDAVTESEEELFEDVEKAVEEAAEEAQEAVEEAAEEVAEAVEEAAEPKE